MMERGSRPTVVASAVLALALLGDSLLYAVLPLHAGTFGIPVSWVGVLLSANRLIRLVAYPLLARAAAVAGLRRFTFAAAAVGAGSTLIFASGTGALPLLAARIAWGIAFGALSLAAFGYATADADGSGARIGLSFSLREVGPLASLSAGTLLVTLLDIRPALTILGATSLLALPLSRLLPDQNISASPRETDFTRTRGGTAPITPHELLSGALGLVSDGFFPATIALILAPSAGVRGAVVGAATMLALKRVATIVMSPVAGRCADRFGTSATITAGVSLTGTGAFLIAAGSVVGGSALLICGTAIATTSIPLAATMGRGDRLTSLARIGLARDAGAAAGPLVAMELFQVSGTATLYVGAGLILFGVSVGGRANGVVQSRVINQETMRKPTAILGSMLFFLIAPATVAGIVPWWITRWRVATLPFGLAQQIAGAILIAAGASVLLHAFSRFALEGLGTPAPVAPTANLVTGGLYRYVRNPMYLAVLSAVIGQAILFGQASLAIYAAALALAFVTFVRLYEEPKLRSQFGAQYDDYRKAVPGWWPHLRR